MNRISCYVNFKENLNKNLPYYDLLIRQINGSGQDAEPWCGEHAILCSGTQSKTVSKICEGYQFTIVFLGYIHSPFTLKNKLLRFGYHFFTDDHAEIVLTAYIHYGEDFIKQISGEFSLIIYDSMRRQIFATQDSHATSVLFYSNIDDFWVLSSSVTGFFAHPKIPKKVSGACVLELICVQNRISKNIFENINILKPGEILKITANKAETKFVNDLQSSPKEPILSGENQSRGIIFSDDPESHSLLKSLCKTQTKRHNLVDVYAEKAPESACALSARLHKIPTDHSSVLEGLSASVDALGIPFLTAYDLIIARTIKSVTKENCELFFSMPDRSLPKKSYLCNLLENNAFTSGIKNNMESFSSSADIFLPYPKLIGSHFDRTIKTPFATENACSLGVFEDIHTKKILRRILLDIISKEYPPITAFFRKEALLKLCEGGFRFFHGQSENELISYLIKLNLWFEKFRPQII